MKNIQIKDILNTFTYTSKITLCENHGNIEELEKIFSWFLEWYVVFFEPCDGELTIVIQKEKFY